MYSYSMVSNMMVRFHYILGKNGVYQICNIACMLACKFHNTSEKYMDYWISFV